MTTSLSCRVWVVVDWGTTNFRAFLLRGGELLDSLSAEPGLLSIQEGAFEATLCR